MTERTGTELAQSLILTIGRTTTVACDMTNTSTSRKAVWPRLLAVAAVLLAVGIFWFSDAGATAYLAYTRWHFSRSVRVGMSRSQVIARLGPPDGVAHSCAEFGMTNAYKPTPGLPVTGEVLEYYHYAWKLYVYVSPGGKVTHVFFART